MVDRMDRQKAPSPDLSDESCVRGKCLHITSLLQQFSEASEK